MLSRNKIAMLMAEFLGTGILTAALLAVGRSQLGFPILVALPAGLTLAVLVVVLGFKSGAHLNPAITLGLWSARRIKTLPAIAYIAAQLLGAVCAYLLYTYYTNNSWPNAGKFESRLLVAEAAGAFVFALGWAATVYQRMEGVRAAFVIGSSFAAGILVSSVASLQLLNPAFALGFRSWVWGTHVLGPVLGAVIGFNLYALVFAPADALTSPLDKPAKAAAKKK